MTTLTKSTLDTWTLDVCSVASNKTFDRGRFYSKVTQVKWRNCGGRKQNGSKPFRKNEDLISTYSGIIPTLAKIWREEGVLGFLRGNGTNIIRIVPYSATQFAAYEKYKRLLLEEGKTELDAPRRLSAGALAGITSVACTYPLDIVRTRLSVQSATLSGKEGQKKLAGIASTMKIIYITEGGIMALYRGLAPTLLGVAPYVALNFHSYEVLRKYFTPVDKTSPPVAQKLLCGALAGSFAQTITYPLDVLRRRMQVTGMKELEYKYNNTWDALTQLIKREGIRGLYKGMVPNYLKVAPAISVSFVTYEACKDFMGDY
ncbi:10557_t:CDS:2 [Cetraspora pellucida]|uniref:10557_t:CDS:1 n=1 Tax=Cetraspora pellucida TaxID=1433469 RepID=A0A9N9CPW4_9GLOM|nr:10557_t:CDS:2 [Cetraspora pellucida]